MRKKIRLLALLLAVLLLCGCQKPATTATTSPATQPVEPVTQATEPAPIDNEVSLRAALEAGGRVIIEGDILLTSKVGVKGSILDGGGHTITGPELQQEEVETENGKEMKNIADTETAVLFSKGTIENMTIRGAYRCLGDGNGYSVNGDVRIRNVDAEGTLYALQTRSGNKEGSLYVENCTLRGWVNINKVKTSQFKNCTFGYTSEGKNGYFRCFMDSTLIGCQFEPYVDENGKKTPYNISFYKTTSGVTLVLEDCYVGDTLITQENIKTLLKLTPRNNNIIVRNTVQSS